MTPQQRRVALVASLGSFVSFLDTTIVNIAFPSISATFHGASRADLSWVLNAYAIVFAALLVPAGRLADLFGRRKLFQIGLAIFTLASAACALAPSVEALIAGRVVQAMGAAILGPTSLAILLPAFPASKRAMAVGLWGAAGGVAAAMGPTLGGLLIDQADWRWVFLVNLPVGAFAIFGAARWVAESKDPTGGRLPDLVGVALLASGIGFVALGLVEGQSWGWGSARVLGSFFAAAVLLPAFVLRSLHHADPLFDPRLLRVRSFAFGNLGTLLFSAGFYAAILGNILFLIGVWGYGTLKAGLAVSPTPLLAAAFAGPAGRLADRYGQRAVILPGAVVYLGGIAWLLRVGTTPDYLGAWLPGAVLMGIGIGLAFSTLAGAVAASLGPASFGVGSAVGGMSRQIGAVLGVAALVAIIGTPTTPQAALDAFHAGRWFSAAAAGATILAAAGLGRVRVAVDPAAAGVVAAQAEPAVA